MSAARRAAWIKESKPLGLIVAKSEDLDSDFRAAAKQIAQGVVATRRNLRKAGLARREVKAMGSSSHDNNINGVATLALRNKGRKASVATPSPMMIGAIMGL